MRKSWGENGSKLLRTSPQEKEKTSQSLEPIINFSLWSRNFLLKFTGQIHKELLETKHSFPSILLSKKSGERGWNENDTFCRSRDFWLY